MYTLFTDMQILPPKQARVELRVADDDLEAWRGAAAREKSTLSEWIRRACDGAIEATKKKRA